MKIYRHHIEFKVISSVTEGGFWVKSYFTLPYIFPDRVRAFVYNVCCKLVSFQYPQLLSHIYDIDIENHQLRIKHSLMPNTRINLFYANVFSVIVDHVNLQPIIKHVTYVTVISDPPLVTRNDRYKSEPGLSVLVLGLIHWHAIDIWLKLFHCNRRVCRLTIMLSFYCCVDPVSQSMKTVYMMSGQFVGYFNCYKVGCFHLIAFIYVNGLSI